MTKPNAAQSTYDALLYTLRQGGAAKLNEKNTRSRLAELSTTQILQLIAALRRLQQQYARTITDELIAVLKEQLR
jgi:hypothetical protein